MSADSVSPDVVPAEWHALTQYYEPWVSQPGAQFILKIGRIWERYARLTAGVPLEGDKFGIVRELFRLAGAASSKSDMVWMAMLLGRFDDNAEIPWQIVLTKRPTTRRMRENAKALRAASRKQTTRDRQYSLFLRVIDYKHKTNASLERAFFDVAEGKDGPFGLLQIKPRIVTVATVKSAYMQFIGSARQTGRITVRKGGMFGSRLEERPIGPLRGKGRPKKS